MKKIILLALMLATTSLFAQPIQRNKFTLATDGSPISGTTWSNTAFAGTNNFSGPTIVSNPASVVWIGNALGLLPTASLPASTLQTNNFPVLFTSDGKAYLKYINSTNIGTGGTGNDTGPETNYAFGASAPVAYAPALTFEGSGGKIGNLPLDNIQAKLNPVPTIGCNLGPNAPNEALVTNVVDRMVTNRLVLAGFSTLWIEDLQYSNRRVIGVDGLSHLAANPTNFPNGFPYTTAYVKSKGLFPVDYLQTGSRGDSEPGTAPQYIETDIRDAMDWGYTDIGLDFHGTFRTLDSYRDLLRRVRATAMDYNYVISDTNPLPRGLRIHGANLNDDAHATMWVSEFSTLLCQFPDTLPIFHADSSNGMRTVVYYMENFHLPNTKFVGNGCFFNANLFLGGAVKPPALEANMNKIVSLVAEARTDGTVGTFYGWQMSKLCNGEWWAALQDPSTIVCKEVMSNYSWRVFSRPLGGLGSSTNLLWVVNLESTNIAVTIAATNLGLNQYKNYSVREIHSHQILTNFVGSFTVTATPTNGALLKVYPDLYPYRTGVRPDARNFRNGETYIWNTSGASHLLVSDGQRWSSDTVVGTIPFDPSDLAGLAIQYEANTSFPSQKYGTYVSGWEDRSGYGRSQFPIVGLASYDGLSGPIFTNDANIGRDVLYFDGGRAMKSATNVIFAQPITIFTRCTIPNVWTGNGGAIVGASTGDFTVYHDEIDRTNQMCLAVSAGGSAYFNGVASGTEYINLEVCFNGASSYVKTNGVSVGTFSVSSSYNWTNPAVGYAASVWNGAFNQGKISDILIYTNAVLTGVQETNVLNWLNRSNTTVTATNLTQPLLNVGFFGSAEAVNIQKNTSGSIFYGPYGSQKSGNVEGINQMWIPAGTYTNLFFNYTYTAFNAGTNITFIIRTNGASAITCVLNGAATSFAANVASNTTSSFTLSAPTLCSLQITNNSPGAIDPTYFNWFIQRY